LKNELNLQLQEPMVEFRMFSSLGGSSLLNSLC
jgi:hypothetical protein